MDNIRKTIHVGKEEGYSLDNKEEGYSLDKEMNKPIPPGVRSEKDVNPR